MDHLEALTSWIGGSRWFGGKGRDFSVTGTRRLGVLPGGPPRVAIDLVSVRYTDGEDELYQAPLVFYPEPQERLAHALVGEWEDPDLGDAHVYDALHDRNAMELWLRGFRDGSTTGGLRFHAVAGHDVEPEVHSTLFTGEQSNSSVLFGEEAIMKVFRRITPGVNPDIEVHKTLTTVGSDHVAALHGWLEAGPQDPHDPGSVLHLAMLQEYLRTASDGWELAQASVRNLFAEADLHPDEVGGDFAGEAGRLGTALRETHELLAEHFATSQRSREEMAGLASAMHQRLDQALAVVPDLEASAPLVRSFFDAVSGLGPVRVQRVHGDLHLGQTLRTVRGWKIVDFEGEPARPLAQRMLPDSVWRDVAGMLRSFDYAPRAVAELAGPTSDGAEQRDYRAREWSARNRRAFLDAYVGEGGLSEQDRLLLAAYVADKAVYEVVYEARNRPGWLRIPLEGIAELGRHGLHQHRIGRQE